MLLHAPPVGCVPRGTSAVARSYPARVPVGQHRCGIALLVYLRCPPRCVDRAEVPKALAGLPRVVLEVGGQFSFERAAGQCADCGRRARERTCRRDVWATGAPVLSESRAAEVVELDEWCRTCKKGATVLSK